MSDTSSPDQENGSPPGASYKWWGPGDINAFFGLMLDNLTGLLLVVVLLSGFGFPTDFITSSMIPGTAIGVLLGDLAFVQNSMSVTSACRTITFLLQSTPPPKEGRFE